MQFSLFLFFFLFFFLSVRTTSSSTALTNPKGGGGGGGDDDAHSVVFDGRASHFNHFAIRRRTFKGVLVRKEESVARGRRGLTTNDDGEGFSSSATSAIELKGKARDDGYFYATLTLGTPGKPFETIIDTGSTFTFVTCFPCEDCGTHGENEPYDETKSTTFEEVFCGEGCVFGRCGLGNKLCEYNEQFSEKSRVQGHLVSDVVNLGGSMGFPRINFGCNTLETNMLRTQKANGVLALGRSDAGIHRQLKRAAHARSRMYDGTFGLCMGSFEGNGVLSLGKIPEPHYENFVTSKTKTETVKLIRGSRPSYYNVDAITMYVKGEELKKPGGEDLVHAYGEGFGTVLDTGTTYTYLHVDVFIPFISKIEEKMKKMYGERSSVERIQGGDPKYPDDVCYQSVDENNLLMDGNVNYKFPNFTMDFTGVNDETISITFPAENYLFKHPTENNAFCIGVFNNTRTGTIIGGIFARNVLFEYDDESATQTVKISPNVNCDGLRKALDFDAYTGSTKHPPPPPSPVAPSAPGTPGTGIDLDRAKKARSAIMFRVTVASFVVFGSLVLAAAGIARLLLKDRSWYRLGFMKFESESVVDGDGDAVEMGEIREEKEAEPAVRRHPRRFSLGNIEEVFEGE